jgi:hypothetical protein
MQVKSGSRLNEIVIQNPQDSEIHVGRIAVLVEGKMKMAIEPSVVGFPHLFRIDTAH